MTRFAVRAILLAIKGVAFLVGGLLFGALPLLAIVAYRVLRGGVKVTMWTFGAVVAGAVLIVRNA